MKEVNGDYRRTACHKEVSYSLSFSTSTLTIIQSMMKQGASYMPTICSSQPSQYPTYLKVEDIIEEAMVELTNYYRTNSLRANSEKYQVTAFNLRNREAKRLLAIVWNGINRLNRPHSKYLGVTLDMTLCYKQHK